MAETVSRKPISSEAETLKLFKGRIAAVAGSALTLGFQYAIEVWNRPVIVFEINSEEPHVRKVVSGDAIDYWVRVRVKNVGRTSAQNVRIYLTTLQKVSGERAEFYMDAIQLWAAANGDRNKMTP